MRAIKSYLFSAGALVLLTGVCCAEQEYSRGRYQIIIERAPFGKAEAVIEAEMLSISNNANLQNLESQYRLSFLMKSDTDGEIRAGFQNLKPQPGESKSEIISINETYNGITLIDVNLKESTASVEYGGTVMTLTMEAVKQPARGRNTGNNSNREPMVSVEVVQLSPEELALLREENLIRSREIQMDVLRKGQPPLPVALTQEMDDQLVFEGVLPPLE